MWWAVASFFLPLSAPPASDGKGRDTVSCQDSLQTVFSLSWSWFWSCVLTSCASWAFCISTYCNTGEWRKSTFCYQLQKSLTKYHPTLHCFILEVLLFGTLLFASINDSQIVACDHKDQCRSLSQSVLVGVFGTVPLRMMLVSGSYSTAGSSDRSSVNLYKYYKHTDHYVSRLT